MMKVNAFISTCHKILSIWNINNILVLFLFLLASKPVYAEIDWVSVTLDNDLFIGNDNGYTNGLYLSFFDVGSRSTKDMPNSDFWVAPLMWSMPKGDKLGAVNAYMIGQTMSTPSDITIANPDDNELPYSAVLALTNSYLAVTEKYADRVSTTIGIVGPAALGEEAQKFVHEIVDADKPQGWDTQLENELVFQFTRGRTWRVWESESKRFDFLSNADFALGTIQSSMSTGVTFRYGRNLIESYATTLFNSSRTSNPSAVNGGWYIYGGLQAGYIFNQIFTDGNTFEDSRSVDYDHEYIAATMGLAFSWQSASVTFAVTDSNLIQSGGTEETLENLTQYGTITFAWQL
ncbi:lipid A deacylase LpxR family protein [Alteromonas naphthalenivorans]|nr:lipid A deacylase LpxR family protein [Alteromonas naphthalenivorans]